MRTSDYDIMCIDGKKPLGCKYQVRVDLTELSHLELVHLRDGIDAALRVRSSGASESRCWLVPGHAVEVFIDR